MGAHIALRSYQKEAISAVLADWAAGHKSVLGVASTGSGKTCIFLSLLLDHALTTGKRGLVLAHRLELVQQPMERIEQFWPEWAPRTGIVMADTNECNQQMVIATVQTLARPGRLASLLHYGKIDYVVRDEAHHSVSATDMALVRALRAANPELRLLGVTATPMRADKDGLKKVYQKVSFKYGIKELIKLGHLVPFAALAVQTKVSLKGVREANGDFVGSDLADVFECDNLYDLVLESHKRYAGDRLGIAFTVSVAGAHRLAERFNDAGIPAAAVDGTTPKPERATILNDFRRGRIRMLANCAVLTEGFDAPAISVVHMARPTKSDSLYVQCIGRGLRPHENKDKCVILDYAPEDARNVVMAGDLLGKPREQKKAEEQAAKEGVIIAGFSFTGEGTGIDGDPDEIVLRPLNYMTLSPHAWYYDCGLSTLGLGESGGFSRTLAIVPPNGVAGYRLALIQRPKDSWQEQVQIIAKADDFEVLADRGAELAEEYGVEILTDKGKFWQAQPASEKQLELLRKLRKGDAQKLTQLKRGEAAKLITSTFARRTLRSKGLLH